MRGIAELGYSNPLRDRAMKAFPKGWMVPLLFLGVTVIASCDRRVESVREKVAALLRFPAVGEYCASELTYFSDADFDGHTQASGVMKAVEIDGDDAGADFDDAEIIAIGARDLGLVRMRPGK